MAIRDGNHHGLHWREPHWERAGVMLDQDCDEPLEAPENCAMNDYGAVLRVVGSGIFQIEPHRQLVVELDRCALPVPADRVGDVEIDLRTVESAILLVDGALHSSAFQRALELCF